MTVVSNFFNFKFEHFTTKNNDFSEQIIASFSCGREARALAESMTQ